LRRLPEPVRDRIRTTYWSGAFSCAKTGGHLAGDSRG
jgi:hypothetical protein